MIKFNTFHLKLIAVVTMLIDHIAYTLIPETEPIYYIMRAIGRLAAPLFWFCFTEGYRHTSNRGKYASRLALASLLMIIGNSTIRIFVDEKFKVNPMDPNMFLTIFFMLVAIECFERSIKRFRRKEFGCLLLGLSVCLIVGLCPGYGWVAVFSILCFYFVKNLNWKVIGFVVINTAFVFINHTWLQILANVGVLFLINYSDEKPKHSLKWFFYAFYPIHLWILMIVSKIFH